MPCQVFHTFMSFSMQVIPMREEDIYGSKQKYESFMANLNSLTNIPKPNFRKKYYCKNPVNLQYFHKLDTHFNVKDISYIRRNRIFQVLKTVIYLIEKDLKQCNREDINTIISYSNTINKTSNSKIDFIKDVKCIWHVLFPEIDREGRIDETIIPYVVRHVSKSVSKSQEKRRNDRFNTRRISEHIDFFCQR